MQYYQPQKGVFRSGVLGNVKKTRLRVGSFVRRIGVISYRPTSSPGMVEYSARQEAVVGVAEGGIEGFSH